MIELGSGQATVTCMVASRWAARGETHRLSKARRVDCGLACFKEHLRGRGDAGACRHAGGVAFLTCGTVVQRRSATAGEEHQEALADARRWLGQAVPYAALRRK